MSTESVMPSNHVVPSVVPFSSCPQAFPASGSFPIVVSMKLLFLKHVYLGELLSGPSPFPNQVCKACFMLQILHGPTLICVNPSHPWGQAHVGLLQVGPSLPPRLMCPALLYKTSRQMLYSSPLTVFLQLSMHPQMKPLTTQARNTFLSSSQGPIVSIFPYLPTHPTWPPIQLPSIVNSSTSESVASRLAPHVWDVVQITVWGGSLVTLSLSVYFNSF